jgi:hypothetical protein
LLNDDFRDMLVALFDAGADFLVVGAFAMSAHGYARNTGDLDIWIRREPSNVERVWKALQSFHAPLASLTREDLLTPDIVFQMGVAPIRIDLLTSIDGVEFDSAWESRISLEIEGRRVPVIGIQALIDNKRACGRPKDIADAKKLEGLRRQNP